VNADDPVARAYAEGAEADVITFGLDAGADVRADDVELGPRRGRPFTLSSAGEREPVELAVPGEHMVSNALAAAAVGRSGRRHARRVRAALKGAGVTRWRMETFTGRLGDRGRERRVQREPRVDGGRAEAARWMAQGGVWSRCSDTWPSSARSRSRSTSGWASWSSGSASTG
jgi:hypothetical protein